MWKSVITSFGHQISFGNKMIPEFLSVKINAMCVWLGDMPADYHQLQYKVWIPLKSEKELNF